MGKGLAGVRELNEDAQSDPLEFWLIEEKRRITKRPKMDRQILTTRPINPTAHNLKSLREQYFSRGRLLKYLETPKTNTQI
jgi:hypothetical protein